MFGRRSSLTGFWIVTSAICTRPRHKHAVELGMNSVLVRHQVENGQSFHFPSRPAVLVRLAGYLMPTTIESGPIRCSTRVSVKPISRIHCWQSAPV